MASALVVLVSAMALSACSSASQDEITYYLEDKIPGESLIFTCTTQKEQNQIDLFKTNQQNRTKIMHVFWESRESTFKKMYENRIQVDLEGSSNKLSITITQLTEEDSGVYWCEYEVLDSDQNIIRTKSSEAVALLIKSPVRCPVRLPDNTTPKSVPNSDSSFISTTIFSIITVVVFMMFVTMLVFYVRYKKKTCPAQAAQSRGNDSVYEVMSTTLRRT